MKGFIGFLAVALLSLFWVTQKGLDLIHAGYGWVAYAQAPVLAAAFAFLVAGKPGKGLVAQDDQEHVLLSLFWWVFIGMTAVLLLAAFGFNREA